MLHDQNVMVNSLFLNQKNKTQTHTTLYAFYILQKRPPSPLTTFLVTYVNNSVGTECIKALQNSRRDLLKFYTKHRNRELSD